MYRGGVLLIALALCLLCGVGGAGGATPPTVETEPAGAVTGTDAVLRAEIDPQEATGAGVFYQFQLASDSGGFSSEILCPAFLPAGYDACAGTASLSALPIGHLDAGTLPNSVELDLGAAGITLRPGTTYHYRVVAAAAVASEDTIEWSAPTVAGEEQAFTTPEPPSVEGESVSGVTQTDAILEAVVDPHGAGASYHFELARSPACLPVKAPFMPCAVIETADLPTVSLPPGEQPVPVALDLASVGVKLAPNSLYSFRVVVSGPGGEAEGVGQSFSTEGEACPAGSAGCGGMFCPRTTAPCWGGVIPRIVSRTLPWRYVGRLGRRTFRAKVDASTCRSSEHPSIRPTVREHGRRAVITMTIRRRSRIGNRPCERVKRFRVLTVKLRRPLAGLGLYDGSTPTPQLRRKFPSAGPAATG